MSAQTGKVHMESSESRVVEKVCTVNLVQEELAVGSIILGKERVEHHVLRRAATVLTSFLGSQGLRALGQTSPTVRSSDAFHLETACSGRVLTQRCNTFSLCAFRALLVVFSQECTCLCKA